MRWRKRGARALSKDRPSLKRLRRFHREMIAKPWNTIPRWSWSEPPKKVFPLHELIYLKSLYDPADESKNRKKIGKFVRGRYGYNLAEGWQLAVDAIKYQKIPKYRTIDDE